MSFSDGYKYVCDFLNNFLVRKHGLSTDFLNNLVSYPGGEIFRVREELHIDSLIITKLFNGNIACTSPIRIHVLHGSN